MAYSRYCLLPLVLVFGVIAMLFVCLGLTIGLAHKTSAVYISDTGSSPPERGIFTFTLNIGAFGIAMLLILHYRYVAQYGGPTKLNKATLAIGLLAALGLSIVGAFEWMEAFYVHIFGAALVFLLGTAFAWMETVLSYKLRHTGTSVRTFRLRLFLAILVTASLVPFVVTLSLAISGTVQTTEVVMSAVTFEWILGVSLLTFLATLAWELRKVTNVVVSLDVKGFYDLKNTAKLSSSTVIPNAAVYDGDQNV